jgi:uncharacterized membrane protein required for colicin V production
MTTWDWTGLLVIFIAGMLGLRRGLVAGALTIVGIGLGAWIGSRVGPHVLHGGHASSYLPVAALAGAVVCAGFGWLLGSMVGSILRTGLWTTPFLRTIDAAGGFVFGAIAGCALVWVVGTVLLEIPDQPKIHKAARDSRVLQRLYTIAPPVDLLDVLRRIDPFPALTGPVPLVGLPDATVAGNQPVVRAGASVVRVLSTACGLGIEGSGWVAGHDRVITAAHVVAGSTNTKVELPRLGFELPAKVAYFDRKNDLAVLTVGSLPLPPLRYGPPAEGAAVAILGYPRNGPFAAVPGRIGTTLTVAAIDAYGHPVRRTITSLRGPVVQGNSGSPAVDADGVVRSTVFAARPGADAGYGVPTAFVRRALAHSRGPVSTGPCTRP